MTQTDAGAVAARIDELLGTFDSAEAPGARETAEELVRSVVAFYGEGLSRIVEILRERDEEGDEFVRALAADDLVAGLLGLHDLHPVPITERVARALESVRPYLGSHSGDVDLLGIDDDGVVNLRLRGSCDGCPSSAVTVKLAIENAIRSAAPEVADIAVEGMAEPGSGAAGPGGRPLLPVVTADAPGAPGTDGAVHGTTPQTAAAGDGGAQWVTVDALGELPAGSVTSIRAGAHPITVCNVDGSLYAYRDRCAACGGVLEGARLDGSTLSCPTCRERFDVHLAGRGETRPGLHLAPLPLLSGDGAVHIALPAEVAS